MGTEGEEDAAKKKEEAETRLWNVVERRGRAKMDTLRPATTTVVGTASHQEAQNSKITINLGGIRGHPPKEAAIHPCNGREQQKRWKTVRGGDRHAKPETQSQEP